MQTGLVTGRVACFNITYLEICFSIEALGLHMARASRNVWVRLKDGEKQNVGGHTLVVFYEHHVADL